jgi:ActR/RegA family two-component response regulator
MAFQERTLLIVEDDKVYNAWYSQYCRDVLDELSHVKGTIKQAFSYSQAKNILDTESVDFISVDIALAKEEEDKTDEQREYSEAGGMLLLKNIQATNTPPLAIVVSGETLLSYAIDAYQGFGILAFYQKDRFDIDQYKQAIKAALYYLDAAEYAEKTEIGAVLESWGKALAAAKAANIKEKYFPEDIGEKVKVRWTHPVTGLPNGHWTEEKLRNRVVGQQDWGVLLKITIHGFSKFVARFASQEEAILTLVVGSLKQVYQKLSNHDCFIGHLGYYDYSSEPSFIIIPDDDTDKINEAINQFKSNLEEKTGLFLPAIGATANQQELMLSVETRILRSSEYSFEDLHRVLDTLGSTTLNQA